MSQVNVLTSQNSFGTWLKVTEMETTVQRPAAAGYIGCPSSSADDPDAYYDNLNLLRDKRI